MPAQFQPTFTHPPSQRWVGRCVIGVLLILTVAGLATPLAAKKKKPITKEITGMVMDAAGNPIARASVELTDKQTSKTVAIYTEDSGQYRFADLPPDHDYEVLARYQNQTSALRKVSSLDDREQMVVNLTIPPEQK